MKTGALSIMLVAMFAAGLNVDTQTDLRTDSNKLKTVFLINAHLRYPGMSEGKLNATFYDIAKKFFLSQSYRVLETKISDGYNVEEEVEKHMQADIIILQTPVNWENTPWIYKKYVDDVFTSALHSKKFLSGDGRSKEDHKKQYGTGGKMQGKKFMISATWNAPAAAFNDGKQQLFKGRSADDALFNIAANYLFTGFTVVPGFYCYDVFNNKHIKQDFEGYQAYLKKAFK